MSDAGKIAATLGFMNPPEEISQESSVKAEEGFKPLNKKLLFAGALFILACLVDVVFNESTSSTFSMLGWSLGLLLIAASLPTE